MNSPPRPLPRGVVRPSVPLAPRITPARLRRLFVRIVRLACWVAGAIGIACGTYLTLKKSSMLQEVWWLPGNVARWADNYGRFRNFPAYAVLALPFMIAANGRRARFNAFRWLALFGAVVEALQYFIPTRWCEWQDVAWSWAGLLATWIVVELGYKAAWEIRCAIVRKPDPERTALLVDAVLTRVPPTRKRS